MGEGPRAEKIATAHMLTMLSVITCFACCLIWLRPDAAPAGLPAILTVALSSAGFVAVTVGGWLRGELVFRHGVGSDSA